MPPVTVVLLDQELPSLSYPVVLVVFPDVVLLWLHVSPDEFVPVMRVVPPDLLTR